MRSGSTTWTSWDEIGPVRAVPVVGGGPRARDEKDARPLRHDVHLGRVDQVVAKAVVDALERKGGAGPLQTSPSWPADGRREARGRRRRDLVAAQTTSVRRAGSDGTAHCAAARCNTLGDARRREERGEWGAGDSDFDGLLGRANAHARRLVLARRADAVGVGVGLGSGARALAAPLAEDGAARRIAAGTTLAVGGQLVARDVAHAAEERPRRVALEDEMTDAEAAAAGPLLGDGREKREQERQLVAAAQRFNARETGARIAQGGHARQAVREADEELDAAIDAPKRDRALALVHVAARIARGHADRAHGTLEARTRTVGAAARQDVEKLVHAPRRVEPDGAIAALAAVNRTAALAKDEAAQPRVADDLRERDGDGLGKGQAVAVRETLVLAADHGQRQRREKVGAVGKVAGRQSRRRAGAAHAAPLVDETVGASVAVRRRTAEGAAVRRRPGRIARDADAARSTPKERHVTRAQARRAGGVAVQAHVVVNLGVAGLGAERYRPKRRRGATDAKGSKGLDAHAEARRARAAEARAAGQEGQAGRADVLGRGAAAEAKTARVGEDGGDVLGRLDGKRGVVPVKTEHARLVVVRARTGVAQTRMDLEDGLVAPGGRRRQGNLGIGVLHGMDNHAKAGEEVVEDAGNVDVGPFRNE